MSIAHRTLFPEPMSGATLGFLFVRVSANRKVGPLPVTYSKKSTCPPSCVLMDNGCYADNGPTAFAWRRSENGITFDDLCLQIRALPKNALWRHNVAGDLPGDGEQIDGEMLKDLVAANSGRRGFTYTHKPMDVWMNYSHVKAANRGGFTINLSTDNLDQVDQLMDDVSAPIVTLLPIDAKPITRTPNGHKVIACPAEVSASTTCANCGWCARADRDFVVGFRAHGQSKKKVDLIARQAA